MPVPLMPAEDLDLDLELDLEEVLFVLVELPLSFTEAEELPTLEMLIVLVL